MVLRDSILWYQYIGRIRGELLGTAVNLPHPEWHPTRSAILSAGFMVLTEAGVGWVGTLRDGPPVGRGWIRADQGTCQGMPGTYQGRIGTCHGRPGTCWDRLMTRKRRWGHARGCYRHAKGSLYGTCQRPEKYRDLHQLYLADYRNGKSK